MHPDFAFDRCVMKNYLPGRQRIAVPRSLDEIWWLVAAGIRVRKARLLNAFVAAGRGNSEVF